MVEDPKTVEVPKEEAQRYGKSIYQKLFQLVTPRPGIPHFLRAGNYHPVEEEIEYGANIALCRSEDTLERALGGGNTELGAFLLARALEAFVLPVVVFSDDQKPEGVLQKDGGYKQPFQLRTTPYGRLPEAVLGQDNQLYKLDNAYFFDENGTSKKLERISLPPNYDDFDDFIWDYWEVFRLNDDGDYLDYNQENIAAIM